MALDNKSILIIDDTPSIRSFLRIFLTSQKAKVLEAATGQEGLMLAAAHQPSIVILDLGLPDIDGLDLLPTLRAQTGAKTTVVILSVRHDSATVEKAYALGAKAYVTKPFLPVDLLDQLQFLLAA